MNLTQAIGAQFREVDARMHQEKPVRVVRATRLYNTDIEDLWDALTNPERLARWFSPVSGALEPGGRYQIEGNAEGTIERCQRPSTLDLTWEFGGNVSWVTVRLESQANNTCMTLEHITTKDEASEAHWQQYGPGATGVGWDLALLGLGLHLDATNGIVDRDAVEAWTMSDDGKSFIRNCAEAWGAAQIENGTSPDLAKTRATHTGDFYTGE